MQFKKEFKFTIIFIALQAINTPATAQNFNKKHLILIFILIVALFSDLVYLGSIGPSSLLMYLFILLA